MRLPKLEEVDLSGKRVLVRVDLDSGKDTDSDTKRQEVLLSTLDYLAQRASKIVLIGHRGRPGGKVVESLSLKPAGERLEAFLKDRWGEERVSQLNMFVMENLRFNAGEEANNEHFSKHLAEDGDVYVNEAFATSHRKHASIVGLPRFLPHAAGFHFVKEIEHLSGVLEKPKRPLVAIISGIKEDKLSYIEDFGMFSDVILVGGRLPALIQKSKLPPGRARGKIRNDPSASHTRKRFGLGNSKIKIAKLTGNLLDIDEGSIQLFEEEIAKAGTIVLSGPMGKFEEESHRQGTERILKAVVESNAFIVAGGGDTKRAISTLGLTDKFDWISVGGGAMLEFLAKGTLPGIQALLN